MRKRLTAVVLAVLVFSLIAASAASLGGITTADVGADVEAVASCETDGSGVNADFETSYDATAGEYVVDVVDISGIHADCDGQTIEVTLQLEDPDNPGSFSEATLASATVGGTTAQWTTTDASLPVLAEWLVGVAVVIYS